MIKKVIFCIGVPASGKSTWSKDFVKNNLNYVRVCRDDYRYMLKNSGWFEDEIRNKLENLITNFIFDDIINLLNAGFNVVIDETNVDKKRLIRFLKVLKSKVKNLDIDFKIFDAPYETLIERDKNRERSVGESVIRRMYGKYQHLINNFNDLKNI